MSCITEEFARQQSDYVLEKIAADTCLAWAIEEQTEITRRRIAKFYNCPYHILFGVKEMKNDDNTVAGLFQESGVSRGQGQWVNGKPKICSSHDLGFLIRDKSGELTQIAVKDIDSAMLHDILDRADEIVISRVDVK